MRASDRLHIAGGVVGLKKKIQQKFENWGVDDEMIIHVKSQDWEGEFIDIEDVPDKSILKVIHSYVSLFEHIYQLMLNNASLVVL